MDTVPVIAIDSDWHWPGRRRRARRQSRPERPCDRRGRSGYPPGPGSHILCDASEVSEGAYILSDFQ